MFTLTLLAAACPGAVALTLQLLVMEVAAAFVARRPGPARTAFAWLAVVDLVLPSMAFLAALPPSKLFPWGAWPLYVPAGGYACGVALMLAVWRRAPGSKSILPRRVLAALALAVVVGAGPAGYLAVRFMPLQPWPQASALWGLFLGTPLYLAPLWDVLVRGWRPKTAADLPRGEDEPC